MFGNILITIGEQNEWILLKFMYNYLCGPGLGSYWLFGGDVVNYCVWWYAWSCEFYIEGWHIFRDGWLLRLAWNSCWSGSLFLTIFHINICWTIFTTVWDIIVWKYSNRLSIMFVKIALLIFNTFFYILWNWCFPFEK